MSNKQKLLKLQYNEGVLIPDINPSDSPEKLIDLVFQSDLKRFGPGAKLVTPSLLPSIKPILEYWQSKQVEILDGNISSDSSKLNSVNAIAFSSGDFNINSYFNLVPGFLYSLILGEYIKRVQELDPEHTPIEYHATAVLNALTRLNLIDANNFIVTNYKSNYSDEHILVFGLPTIINTHGAASAGISSELERIVNEVEVFQPPIKGPLAFVKVDQNFYLNSKDLDVPSIYPEEIIIVVETPDKIFKTTTKKIISADTHNKNNPLDLIVALDVPFETYLEGVANKTTTVAAIFDKDLALAINTYSEVDEIIEPDTSFTLDSPSLVTKVELFPLTGALNRLYSDKIYSKTLDNLHQMFTKNLVSMRRIYGWSKMRHEQKKEEILNCIIFAATKYIGLATSSNYTLSKILFDINDEPLSVAKDKKEVVEEIVSRPHELTTKSISSDLFPTSRSFSLANSLKDVTNDIKNQIFFKQIGRGFDVADLLKYETSDMRFKDVVDLFSDVISVLCIAFKVFATKDKDTAKAILLKHIPPNLEATLDYNLTESFLYDKNNMVRFKEGRLNFRNDLAITAMFKYIVTNTNTPESYRDQDPYSNTKDLHIFTPYITLININ